MTEELKPELAPIEETMTQELVKANVTEAVIASIRERYLPLKIAGLEDKETYLLVKEGRKECKSLRVMAKKICTNGREEATAIQKAWIAKEKEVTGRIAEVEDYLEAQEKEYEAGIAAEKEARKRKEEEQLIIRQQILTNMGAVYTDGCFVLGDVSFELSAIKESDLDVWNDVINAAFLAEYQKIQAEEIEKARLQQEREAELKRKQDEIEAQKKELEAERNRLKEEADRQAAEAKAARAAKETARIDQLTSLGLKFDLVDHFIGYDCFVPLLDITCHDGDKWAKLIDEVTGQVNRKKQEEAEEKRKEQERQELQQKRFSEITPYKAYGGSVELTKLWQFDEDAYQRILKEKIDAYNKKEEEKAKEIAEKAAKAERERIEQEQRRLELKRKSDLRASRREALSQYNFVFTGLDSDFGDFTDAEWTTFITDAKAAYDDSIRKQEEERKAEELAKASDKEKWDEIAKDIEALRVLAGSLVMRSGQYRKKRQILLEKLEEIKAL